MFTPELLNILRKTFGKAKCKGLHDSIHQPPTCLASELVGLTTRKDIATSKHTSLKT